ncbi:uncharacterized protein B0P05DRAFT_599031 [Gilbertella persicaria]|uniref:uncharacterized protein n=1 Tax=Gilbertella persicaria TaxID=101096 RepID=UPI00221EA3CF|nr:uncharacterized protein B0P05DRAFT_599031 [Gilbertella persicaria]KAI8064789.1 hypothetical protein B0P05DRAFT_599031 [Gilbertella persicaria]
MYAEFNLQFAIGECHYICKHGGFKRIRDDETDESTLIDLDTGEEIEVIDTMIESDLIEEAPTKIVAKIITRKSSNAVHSHPISQGDITYAIHRRQNPEVMEQIYSILGDYHRDSVSNVMETMKVSGISNIVKRDVQNIQTLLLKHQDGKGMYSLITQMEYLKTNGRKITLVNIVGTSNVISVKGSNKLHNFAVAVAFVKPETETVYTWILEELLFCAFSHFYYVECSRTPKGKFRKLNIPILNMDHKRLRVSFPSLCISKDYLITF